MSCMNMYSWDIKNPCHIQVNCCGEEADATCCSSFLWSSSDTQSPDSEPTQSDQEPSQSSGLNDSNGNSEQQVNVCIKDLK